MKCNKNILLLALIMTVLSVGFAHADEKQVKADLDAINKVFNTSYQLKDLIRLVSDSYRAGKLPVHTERVSGQTMTPFEYLMWRGSESSIIEVAKVLLSSSSARENPAEANLLDVTLYVLVTREDKNTLHTLMEYSKDNPSRFLKYFLRNTILTQKFEFQERLRNAWIKYPAVHAFWTDPSQVQVIETFRQILKGLLVSFVAESNLVHTHTSFEALGRYEKALKELIYQFHFQPVDLIFEFSRLVENSRPESVLGRNREKLSALYGKIVPFGVQDQFHLPVAAPVSAPVQSSVVVPAAAPAEAAVVDLVMSNPEPVSVEAPGVAAAPAEPVKGPQSMDLTPGVQTTPQTIEAWAQSSPAEIVQYLSLASIEERARLALPLYHRAIIQKRFDLVEALVENELVSLD
jgi:hypothetical protein